MRRYADAHRRRDRHSQQGRSRSRATGHLAKPTILLGLIMSAVLMVGLGAEPVSIAAQPDGNPRILTSQRVGCGPSLDGKDEGVWALATPLRLRLNAGIPGAASTLELELRSIHTDKELYFLATWSEPQPEATEGLLRNKMTMHFEIAAPWPGAQELMCLAACHTAFVDGRGRLAYIAAETIPPGQTGTLSGCGRWEDGRWRLEWSRPLVNANPFDTQFRDLNGRYSFFIKVFRGANEGADPVSETCLLAFER